MLSLIDKDSVCCSLSEKDIIPTFFCSKMIGVNLVLLALPQTLIKYVIIGMGREF